MIGGLLKTTSLAAIAAATVVIAGVMPASAADLGGNCCADLEERVAELEATTVRKGNRKVSVTLSGFVGHSVMYWDDGERSDVYIGDGGGYGSRFRFVGNAKISPTLTAGFLYEFTSVANNIDALNQDHSADNQPNGDDIGCTAAGNKGVDSLGNPVTIAPTCSGSSTTGHGVVLRDTTVWLRHSQLGMVKIGHGSQSTDNLVLIDLGGISPATTSDRSANAGGGLRMIDSATGLYTSFTVKQAAPGYDPTRINHVLYETPALHGFTIQAAVGEDNFWDTALRYAGEFGGFRIAAGIGYSLNSEFNTRLDNAFTGGVVACDRDCTKEQEAILGSASILHVASGLFVSGAAARQELSWSNPAERPLAGEPDSHFWWLAVGMRKNFFGFGDTSIFAEYREDKDALTLLNTVSATQAVSSDHSQWGVGVVQYIDAAAMDMYLIYRNDSTDFVNGAGVQIDTEDIQTITGGMRVNF